MNMHSFTWSPYLGHDEWDEEYPNKVEMDHLKSWGNASARCRKRLKCSLALPKFMAIARRWLPVRNCSTGAARTLAYATLVDEGIPFAVG